MDPPPSRDAPRGPPMTTTAGAAASKKRIRTIAALTDEQVRKKRGSDREAQRAFRERTKSRIQNLEEELHVVRARYEAEIGGVRRELEGVRSANRGLRGRLRRIGEIVGAEGGNEGEDGDGEDGEDGEDGVGDGSITVEVPPELEGRRRRSRRTTTVDRGISHGSAADRVMSSASEIQTRSSPANQGVVREPHFRQRSTYPEILDPTSISEAPCQQETFLGETDYNDNHPTGEIEGFNNRSQMRSRIRTDDYHHSPRNSENPLPFTNQLQPDLLPTTAIPRQTRDSSAHNADSMHDGFLQDSYQYSPGATVHQNYHGAALPISGDPNWAKSPDKQPSHSSSHKSPSNADDYLDRVLTTTSQQPRQVSTFSPQASVMSPAAAAISPQWVQPGNIEQVSKYTILPRHIAATCPLDQILLDFLSSRQLLAAQGTPLNTLIGPLKPSVSGLLDPRRRTEAHAASRVMVDVVATFPDTNLREQLGFLYIMYATMRWQIASDQDSFDNLPSWLHPTVLQVMVPHAAWIDNIPWPNARDLLIQNPVKYPFRDFSEMYARYVRLDWPFDVEDAVMPREDGDSEVLLNPLFEKQVRRLECWSIQEPFRERFPELAAAMRSNQ